MTKLTGSDVGSVSTEMTKKVAPAAVAEATRLCDIAIRALANMSATPNQLARTKRAQMDVFSRTSARTERIVCDLLRQAPGEPMGVSSRDELSAAVDVYCDAGKSEVDRRFAV